MCARALDAGKEEDARPRSSWTSAFCVWIRNGADWPEQNLAKAPTGRPSGACRLVRPVISV